MIRHSPMLRSNLMSIHRSILATLLICIFSTLPAWGQSPDPSAWRDDVDGLLDSLRQIHPDLYHSHTAAEWEQVGTRLRECLSDLSYAEAFAGVARLVALADDGHTFPYLPTHPDF